MHTRWLAALPLLFTTGCFGGQQSTGAASPPPSTPQPEPVARREDEEPAVDDAMKAFEPLLRPAWTPVYDGESEPHGSRFGGCPWLPEGTDWPECASCGNPMHLFAQIDLAKAPGEFSGPQQGLLQVFYCVTGEPLCEDVQEGWEPFSVNSVVRVVPNTDGALGQTDRIEPFPVKGITGWTELRDGPTPDDVAFEEAGIDYDDAEAFLEAAGLPQTGDKWLGWPAWVQGPELPECRKCGRKMDYVLQIDSEDGVPYMFGDVGTAHASVCPDHPEEWAFGWACS